MGHKQYLPDIWGQLQAQIATVKAQKQVLLDETEYWNDYISSSLPEELSQVLDDIAETLRGVRQGLVEFADDLENVVRAFDPVSRSVSLVLTPFEPSPNVDCLPPPV